MQPTAPISLSLHVPLCCLINALFGSLMLLCVRERGGKIQHEIFFFIRRKPQSSSCFEKGASSSTSKERAKL